MGDSPYHCTFCHWEVPLDDARIRSSATTGRAVCLRCFTLRVDGTPARVSRLLQLDINREDEQVKNYSFGKEQGEEAR